MEAKSAALKGFTSARYLFLQDLKALPEEAFTKSFGPKTRTVADIVYEVNLVNDHVGMVLRGEEPFDWPEGGFITAPEDFNQKDQVIAAFENSSQRIIDTIDGISDMDAAVQTEHGERTVFERCQFMTVHLWYHSGQFNFIQTLLGDGDMHWG